MFMKDYSCTSCPRGAAVVPHTKNTKNNKLSSGSSVGSEVHMFCIKREQSLKTSRKLVYTKTKNKKTNRKQMKQWGIMIIIDENEIIKQMETWLHQGAWQWSLTHWEQWRLRQWSLTPWIHTVDALLVWAAAALIHCAHGVRLHNKSANENTYQKLLLKHKKMELLLSLIVVVKTKECKWDHKTTIIYRTHEHHPQQQMMITITTRTKNTTIKQMKTLF